MPSEPNEQHGPAPLEQRLSNPFRSSFGGNYGRELVGRQAVRQQLRDTLAVARTPEDCTILFGARGSGKTATLVAAMEDARAHGWLVVDTDSSRQGGLLAGLPEAIEEALDTIEGAAPKRSKYVREHHLSLGKLYRTAWKQVAPAARVRSPLKVLTDLAKAATENEANAGVLLVVDELSATSTQDARALGSALQNIITKKYYALQFRGAALPTFKHQTLGHRDLSFFRRCAKEHLSYITELDALHGFQVYAETSDGEFDDDALTLAASQVNGSPYMFQLIGYHSWNASLAPRKPISTAVVSAAIRRAAAEYDDEVSKWTWADLDEFQKDAVEIVFRSDGRHTRETITAWTRIRGLSEDEGSNFVDRLIEDSLVAQDQTTGVLRVSPASGLTDSYLSHIGRMRDAYHGNVVFNPTTGMYQVDAAHASTELAAASQPAAIEAARPELADIVPNGQELCQKWMPRARRYCVLLAGHVGRCRSKPR